MSTRRINRTAPVLPLEYSLDDLGDDVIYPCTDCLPWHLDLRVDDEKRMIIREWHAVDCPVLREIDEENDRSHDETRH